jgi:hypothetical protein
MRLFDFLFCETTTYQNDFIIPRRWNQEGGIVIGVVRPSIHPNSVSTLDLCNY